jgi:hypothetical protein
MNDIKRTKIQEIVAQYSEATNRLSKELAELKKKVMEDREEVVGLMRKEGLLDDVLHFLKKEGDEGDRFSLGLYNLWKYGQLPKQEIKIKQILNN